MDEYKKGYEKWKGEESKRLTDIIKHEAETLSKVSPEHKNIFKKFDDEDKEYYLSFDKQGRDTYIQLNFDEREIFEAMAKHEQEFIKKKNIDDVKVYLHLSNESRAKLPYLTDAFKATLYSLEEHERDSYLELDEN